MPCRVAKNLDCVFQIWTAQCGRVWFTHTVPCRAPAVLRPCRFVRDFSRPRHSTAGARHHMCELTSALSRWPMGDLPNFGFFQLPCGVSRLAVRILPAARGLTRRTRERHRTAGPQRGMCKVALNRPYFLVRLHAIKEDMKEVIVMRCAGSASGHRRPTFRYASVECFTDTRKRVLRLGTRCVSATVSEAILRCAETRRK
jgi:hypothetical protein